MWRSTGRCFPLLVRVGAAGSVGVVDLADHVGRDHSTVSRQLATLEESGLVARQAAAHDARIREARITPAGREIVAAITTARRRALGALLADWSEGGVPDAGAPEPEACRGDAGGPTRVVGVSEVASRASARPGPRPVCA